jgi:hypothetical protein
MTAKEKQTEEREVLTAILDGIRHTSRDEWLEQIREYEAEYAGEALPDSIETGPPVSARSTTAKSLRPVSHKKTASA